MISYKEALAHILALPFSVVTGRIPLMEAAGRILAAPIEAPWPLPRFTNSSMDGYALHAEDAEVVPVTLRLVGESAAGKPFVGAVRRGETICISTGAPVPEGLDGISPVEYVQANGDSIVIEKQVLSKRYMRVRGEDVREGDKLFGRGTTITASVLAFLSSYNIEEVVVFRRPRVGILTSGEEIKEYGSPLGESDIVGSSLYYLQRELELCHCEPRLFGIASDDVGAFRALFEDACEWSDVILTTAGVSVGKHDVVKQVVEELGKVHFWRVAVRPGKPMIVASYGDTHHFGLPGNPVSTCCNFEIFIKPFLRKAFAMPAETPLQNARLTVDCPRDKHRLFFVYAQSEVCDGELTVCALQNQSSGNLYNSARANCLIVLEPGDGDCPKGSKVTVLRVTNGLQ